MIRRLVEKYKSGTKLGQSCFHICTEPLHSLCSLNHLQMSYKAYYHADAMGNSCQSAFLGDGKKKMTSAQTQFLRIFLIRGEL